MAIPHSRRNRPGSHLAASRPAYRSSAPASFGLSSPRNFSAVRCFHRPALRLRIAKCRNAFASYVRSRSRPDRSRQPPSEAFRIRPIA